MDLPVAMEPVRPRRSMVDGFGWVVGIFGSGGWGETAVVRVV